MNAAQAKRAGYPVSAFKRESYDGHHVCTFIMGELTADGTDNRYVELFIGGLEPGDRHTRMVLLPFDVAHLTVHEADLYTAWEIVRRIDDILRARRQRARAELKERFSARRSAS